MTLFDARQMRLTSTWMSPKYSTKCPIYMGSSRQRWQRLTDQPDRDYRARFALFLLPAIHESHPKWCSDRNNLGSLKKRQDALNHLAMSDAKNRAVIIYYIYTFMYIILCILIYFSFLSECWFSWCWWVAYLKYKKKIKKKYNAARNSIL